MSRRRKRHGLRRIIRKLRDADAVLAGGKMIGEVCQADSSVHSLRRSPPPKRRRSLNQSASGISTSSTELPSATARQCEPTNRNQTWGCSRPTPSRFLGTKPPKHNPPLPGYKSGVDREQRPAIVQQSSQRRLCWAGRNCIPSSPRPIHSCSAPSSSKKTGVCISAHTASIVSRCHERHLSRDAACGRNRIQPSLATEATPQPPDLPTGSMASQPFRPGTCARHHP